MNQSSVHSTAVGLNDGAPIDFEPRDRDDDQGVPPSAQSQVLDNPDLLEVILASFHVPQAGPDTPSRIPFPDSQHLVWASLTARPFFDPAMTILWRSMDSWLPLLQLIPVLRKEGGVYNMHGVVHRQDLQRLDVYGRHIRRLDLRSMHQAVSPYIYTYILRHQPCLFPALRELVIPNIERIGLENLPGLFLTVAASLSELSLGGIGPSTESVAGSLLQSVCIEAKSLRRLVLTGRFTTSSLSNVNQFTNLEALEIHSCGANLPQETLKTFSELVSLKSLKISLDDALISDPLSTSLSFEALHNLEISASAVGVHAILRRVTVHHLTTIRIHLTSLGPGKPQESPTQCIQAIGLMTRATKSLKTINITSEAGSVRIPAAELTHLKAWTKVAHIDMVVGEVLPEVLNRLLSTGSWKSIQTLILRSGLAPGQEGGVSTTSIFGWLQSLVFLPNVKHLTTSVAFSLNQPEVDTWRSAVQGPPVCHNLQDLVFLPLESRPKLNCPDQTVENAFIFAQGINHYCPHLRNFDLSRMAGTYVNSDWGKGVELMVIGLQKATSNVHVC
ncbi:hypothetical protein GALMADRAFT_279007 [Galerina marginata CBS 339.88]|uniref:F-box domain-containing protein n=1 Tax=Galerina marginata (strain CBS 339.88) TaxID=685588 RepID=A0A067TDZ5_GALM3|nr:hypothetical protein GALMADRAFT_279007 [Galerina marginata CBS 339.88]